MRPFAGRRGGRGAPRSQHNKLVNSLRLTQRRVINGSRSSCIERPKFQNFTPNCFGQTYLNGLFGDVDTARVSDPATPPARARAQCPHRGRRWPQKQDPSNPPGKPYTENLEKPENSENLRRLWQSPFLTPQPGPPARPAWRQAPFLDARHPNIIYTFESTPVLFVPGFTSPENGYYQYLPINKTQAVATLLGLWQGLWLNEGAAPARGRARSARRCHPP